MIPSAKQYDQTSNGSLWAPSDLSVFCLVAVELQLSDVLLVRFERFGQKLSSPAVGCRPFGLVPSFFRVVDGLSWRACEHPSSQLSTKGYPTAKKVVFETPLRHACQGRAAVSKASFTKWSRGLGPLDDANAF